MKNLFQISSSSKDKRHPYTFDQSVLRLKKTLKNCKSRFIHVRYSRGRTFSLAENSFPRVFSSSKWFLIKGTRPENDPGPWTRGHCFLFCYGGKNGARRITKKKKKRKSWFSLLEACTRANSKNRERPARWYADTFPFERENERVLGIESRYNDGDRYDTVERKGREMGKRRRKEEAEKSREENEKRACFLFVTRLRGAEATLPPHITVICLARAAS